MLSHPAFESFKKSNAYVLQRSKNKIALENINDAICKFHDFSEVGTDAILRCKDTIGYFLNNELDLHGDKDDGKIVNMDDITLSTMPQDGLEIGFRAGALKDTKLYIDITDGHLYNLHFDEEQEITFASVKFLVGDFMELVACDILCSAVHVQQPIIPEVIS
jgi:hypothetical protein